MKVTVTGTFLDAAGNPATGTVALWPAVTAVDETPNPAFVTQSRVTGTLDDTGTVTLQVEASDDPGWQITGDMPYLVQIRNRGLSGVQRIEGAGAVWWA